MSDHPFGLRENPFAAGDVRRFVYPSAEREQLRARLMRGLRDGEPFVLLTGEPGTGKTSIVRETFGNRKDQGSVAIITNPALTRTELLEEICIRFDLAVPETPSKPQLMALLEQHLHKVRGQSNGLAAVLVIDEAHLMDADLLEELRLLANMQVKGRKLLQVVLVGLPALEETLAQRRLEPLRQRITVHAQLRPLGVEQTREYLHHRLVTAGATAELMPDDACDEIHALAHGIAREVNTLASEALVWAHSEGASAVNPEHVRAVAAARPGPTPAPTEPQAAPEAARGRAPGNKRHSDAATGVDASEPPPTETESAPAHAAKPQPATPATPAEVQATPRRRKGEAEVHDWVSRFRGEGPILIGSRAALAPLSMEESLGLDASGGDDRAPQESKPGSAKGPRPAARPRAGRTRRGFRWWNEPARLTLAAVLVLAAAISLILLTRDRETSRSESRPSQAVASGAVPRPARGSGQSPRRDDERPARTPQAQEAARPRGEAPAPTTRAATEQSPPTRYALVVATYLDEDRAREEVDRLATLTALPARARVARDETGTSYRILLGRFESRSDAESAAEDLLGRGIVGEAQITRLSRRRSSP